MYTQYIRMCPLEGVWKANEPFQEYFRGHQIQLMLSYTSPQLSRLLPNTNGAAETSELQNTDTFF